MRKGFIALAAVLTLLFASFAADAATISITNQTGVTIFYLYISGSDTSGWEEDIMGDDVLSDGDTVRLNVQGSYSEFDLRAEDDDDNYIEWYNFPGDTTQITLRGDGTANYK